MATVDELILRVKVENEGGGSAFKDMLSDVKNLGAAGASAFAGMASAATSFAATMAKDVVSSTVSFGKDAVVKLADFRAEMAGVGKTTGLTGEELDKLGKTLRDMSIGDLGGAVAAEDLAQIAAAAGQLGIKGAENIQKFTKDVAELSKATDISADETATVMAKLANQFKDSLEKPRIYFDEFGNSIGMASKNAFQQIANIGSAINELSNNTTATADNLINMTNRIAGIGTTVGLTVDQVAALSATMVDSGLGIEKGSTAMNKMLGELMKNTNAFASTLKIDSQALADALSKDPMKAIEMVLKGMDDMKKSEGPQAMLLAVEQLLGKGDGITALATKLSAKYADLSKNAQMSADAFMKGTSAHDEFMSQTSHTEARWAALGEKMNEFSRRVAELFEPITTWVTEALNGVADIVLENFDVIGNYVSGFVESIKTKLMDVFGPSVMAAFEKGDILGAFSGIYDQLSSMFQDSPLAVLWDGAKAGITALKGEFEVFATFVKDIISSLAAGDFKGAFDAIVEALKGSLGVIGAMISETFSSSALLAPIGESFKVITDYISGIVAEATEMFSGIFTGITTGDFEGAFDAWIEGIKGMVGITEELFQGLLTNIQDWISNFAAMFEGTPLEPFVKEIGDLFNNVIDIIKTLIGVGVELFQAVFSPEIIQGTIGVLVAMLGTVAEGINFVIDGFKQLGTLLGEVFAGDISFGELFSGMATAMKDTFIEAITAIGDFFYGIAEGMLNAIGGIFGIDNLGTTLLAPFLYFRDKAVEIFSAAGDLILGSIGGVIDLIMGQFDVVLTYIADVFTAFEKLGSAIMDFFSGDIGFGELLGAFGTFAADIGSAIWDALTGTFNNIFDWVVGQGSRVAEFGEVLLSPLNDLWGWIKEGFNSFWDWLGDLFSGIGDLLLPPFEGVGSAIVDALKSAFESLWEWLKEQFSGLADLVLGPINTIKDKVSSVLSSVSNTVSGLFSDAEEEVKATTAEVENLTAATNAATAATAELGTEALYQSVYPDLIAALKTTTAETDKLTGSIWETTAAVNKLGVDAIYQSVFPDLADSISTSTEQTDALTDSIKQTTDAAYDLSQTNPTDGWNSAIKSTVSELANAKRALSETSVLSTSSGSTITTSRRLSEGQVASQVESALASNRSSSSGKSLVNRNVTIQFNGTNVVDESSKSRFARDVATAIASINAQTVRG